MSSELAVFSMVWLADHAPVLVVVLQALLPVLCVCVAGYALHIVGRGRKK
jgi:hypothetical protein